MHFVGYLSILKDGDIFLSRIFSSDEMWVHHYDPMKKIRSMEWHYESSSGKKKINVQTSAGKVMASVFCDSEGISSVEFLEGGAKINSERYELNLKQQILSFGETGK